MPSALALAKHVTNADVAIVAMGPGVVGTSSPLGTSALEVAGDPRRRRGARRAARSRSCACPTATSASATRA